MRDFVTAKQRLAGLKGESKIIEDVKWSIVALIGTYIFLIAITQPINGA